MSFCWKRYTLMMALMLGLALALGGCGGGGGGGGGTTAPAITTLVPANGATNVTPDQSVKITFNKPMNIGTITAANIYVKDNASGNMVAGSVSYDATTNTASFTTTGGFTLNTVYDIYVTSGVMDASNKAIGNTQINSFTTATTVWTVTTTTDGNGTVVPATGSNIAVSGVPYTVTITPKTGYIPSILTVDSSNKTAGLVGPDADGKYTYTISALDMTQNRILTVTFAPTFTTTGSIAFANGTPSNSTTVKLYKTSYTIYSTATVSGKLYSTRDASGAESVTIGPLTQETTTTSNGVYTFSGVPSGNYTIVPSKQGYLFKSVLIPTLDRIGVLTITENGTVYLYNPEGSGNQLSADGKIIYNTLPLTLPGSVLSNQDFEASLPGGGSN